MPRFDHRKQESPNVQEKIEEQARLQEAPESRVADATRVMYICVPPHARIKLSTGRYQAVAGLLTLTSAEAAELDTLSALPDRADLRIMFRKVDQAAAAKALSNFRQQQAGQAVAAKGAVQSNTFSRAAQRHAQTQEALTGKTNIVIEAEKNSEAQTVMEFNTAAPG